MSYDAQHKPEISRELERPMMKKLLSCIRDCGVIFSVYLKDDGGFSFTPLVDGDKKLSRLPENCQTYKWCFLQCYNGVFAVLYVVYNTLVGRFLYTPKGSVHL